MFLCLYCFVEMRLFSHSHTLSLSVSFVSIYFKTLSLDFTLFLLHFCFFVIHLNSKTNDRILKSNAIRTSDISHFGGIQNRPFLEKGDVSGAVMTHVLQYLICLVSISVCI